MTFILVAAVFVFMFLVALHLGRFMSDCDERQADIHVTDAAGYAAVKEAERIAREAAK